MKNTITKQDIDNILKDTLIKVEQYGDKTTVLKATLPNNFVIVESSSCVDPANFDMKIGEEICMDKLVNKIWELEGYKLQCITSVKVKKINEENSRLVGAASVVVDKEFIIKDIKIIKGDDRLFLAMPSQKMPDGSYADIAHPLNVECRKKFEDIILAEYDKC